MPRTAIAALLGVALAFAFRAEPLRAQPQIPANFYGSATIDGRPVPDGTEVLAFIGGVDCTQRGPSFRGTVTVDGVSAYSIAVLHESQRPGCGAPGKVVTFTVGGRPANETGVWAYGPQQLDLNAGSGRPLPLPTSTPTPTVRATPTVPFGSPVALPTDDVSPPTVFGAATEPRATPGSVAPLGGEARSPEEGGRGWAWVVGAVVLALGTVAAGGWAVLRRRHRSAR